MSIFGKKKPKIELSAPVEGKVIPLSKVNDSVFSAGIMGQGAAIIPSGNTVCAPADGEIESIFETGHALSMNTDNGMNILIHIGIDTVTLNGKYFNKLVKKGDRVGRGEPLIEAEMAKIAESGLDNVTVISVINSDKYDFEKVNEVNVKSGETIIKVRKK